MRWSVWVRMRLGKMVRCQCPDKTVRIQEWVFRDDLVIF